MIKLNFIAVFDKFHPIQEIQFDHLNVQNYHLNVSDKMIFVKIFQN